jgi:predicted AlkP superfamily pyrophosphatase or phosphodiesterase
MERRFSRGLLCAPLAFALTLLFIEPADPAPQADEEGPQLAVLVVFDQLRGDYLARWEKLFAEGGFRRLQKDGAWFRNCHYPYAGTLTAPGHASMATGCPPARHGIIANDWYDRDAGAKVNAVRSERYRPVPEPAGAPKDILGAAPVRRRRQAVGDWLHKASKGKAKLVSLSIKDRAAILLAALLRGQICYWFSTNAGQFVTSTYYADRLHDWVQEFNKRRPADRWFGKDWTRLRADLDYAAFSGPDDVKAEGVAFAQGRTFPHPMTGGKEKIGRAYYEAMTTSPYGNELLLEFAKHAIDAEKLGRNGTADLLTLSFSSNDLIGHCWGPDSQEVLDVTLRSDRIVKELLDFLDARVGRGRYLLVVCSDHGICPIPDVAAAQGKDAARVPPALLTTKAGAFLDETFAKGKERQPWVEKAMNNSIYLNRGVLKELGLESAKVEDALAQWLAKQPGVQAAYTRGQLTRGPLKDDRIGEMVRRSFDPERSGDVVVVTRPYHVIGEVLSEKVDNYRTTHGSPHPYDTHVPLLVYGPGVRAGVRDERVTPLSVAAILARGLGVSPPEGAEGPVPEGLFK